MSCIDILNTGIVGFNPTEGRDVCVCVSCVCVGTGLATGSILRRKVFHLLLLNRYKPEDRAEGDVRQDFNCEKSVLSSVTNVIT